MHRTFSVSKVDGVHRHHQLGTVAWGALVSTRYWLEVNLMLQDVRRLQVPQHHASLDEPKAGQILEAHPIRRSLSQSQGVVAAAPAPLGSAVTMRRQPGKSWPGCSV
jgi:hypothetical protein